MKTMETKTISVVVVAHLLLSVSSKAGSLGDDSKLRVYLPREITLEESTIRLGQVGIIRGEESLVAKAGEITLGRISAPRQKVVVDRGLILSRLACNGIPVSKVTLTGSERVTVKRQQRIIEGNEFAEAALSFLKKNPPGDSICEFELIRIPEDFVIPRLSEDIRLSADLGKSAVKNQVKVQVVVFSRGKPIGTREVTFGLKYNCYRVVTRVDIPRGAVISPDNVKIEKRILNYRERGTWDGWQFWGTADGKNGGRALGDTSENGAATGPYGLVSRRRLPAGSVLRPSMLERAKPEVIVKRNQSVIVRLDTSGLLITASGKALQDGRIGEYIKVRMLISNESQRIITAKVKGDGTLEPIL